jgi:hypothetical protein
MVSLITSVSGGTTLTSVLPVSSQTSGAVQDDSHTSYTSEKGSTIVISWTSGQTFLATYLAVTIAVLYRIIWTMIHNSFNLVEPFSQLSEPNGALGDSAFSDFYQSQFFLPRPVGALLRRRRTLALTATGYLVACFLPAVPSETIFVDTHWACLSPATNSNNPCFARMTANITVLRVLQGMLAFMAPAVLIAAIALLATRTGLPASYSTKPQLGSPWLCWD